MFLIKWRPDCEKEEIFQIVEKTFHDMHNTLFALTKYHELLRDLKTLKSNYSYECFIMNIRRGEYIPWEDEMTGIKDPLEYMEYLENV